MKRTACRTRAASLGLFAWLSLLALAVEAGTGEKPVFDILEYDVDGNKSLETKTIEKTVYPYLGTDRTLDDVEKAREELEKVYRSKGYSSVLVDIPEQDVVDGVVKLQVVEGTIQRLKITGSRYYSLGRILEGLPALAEGQTPHMPTVQEQLGKLNQESADRSLTPIFRAGKTPGEIEAEIRVKDQLPVHGSAEINGMNTEHTTRPRIIGTLRYDNLWQLFHSASLQFQVSPENTDEVEVWSGVYAMPLGWENARLSFYGIGINSSNNLGATVGGQTVVGNGAMFGARFGLPLGQVGDYLHSVSAGVDYKDFMQTVRLSGSPDSGTPIKYLPFTLGYEGIWRRGKALSSLALSGHFSIRGLGNNQREFDNKRYNSLADFFYFTVNFKHQRELPWDFRLAFRAAGQIADSPLISNEQFSLGGWQTVRGYYQTQQLGDNGLNLATELYGPNLFPARWEFAQSLRALVFFDWGYLWILDPLPRNPGFYKLASFGGGLRAQLFNHWLGELDLGFPMYPQSTVHSGHQRIDFRLAYEF